MEGQDVFVQNVHANGIKVDGTEYENGKAQKWEKVFLKQAFDENGREVTTGFTRLSPHEYDLCRRNKLFQYFQSIGKLVVHDDLPTSAMTPHEALAGARKQIRSLQEEYAELQRRHTKTLAEVEALQSLFAQANKSANEKTPKRGKNGKNAEPAAALDDEAQIAMAF